MNNLIRKEIYFLRLLLHTSNRQKKVLLQSIEKSQLRAIVQIVYNLMQGYRSLPEKDKQQLAKRKAVIRQFVSKNISFRKRKALLFKYYKFILPFIDAIKNELL